MIAPRENRDADSRGVAESQGNVTGTARPADGRRMPRHLWRVSLTAGAVALVGVGTWLLLSHRDAEIQNDDGAEKVAPRPVRTDAPASPAPEAEPKVEAPVVDPNARPTKVGEVVNGYVMLPSGRIHKPTGVVTNRVANYGKSKYSIFEHRSDNEIAALLMMNPGDTVVGSKRYDQWFAGQFLKSLEQPIADSQDDEPWQSDLKNLVKQARLELKAAYDRGEDIAAIMSESRQQLQDLAKYKLAVKQLYAQNMKECQTEEEVAELQRAINVMLEEKGCAPISFTSLTKMNILKEKVHE